MNRKKAFYFIILFSAVMLVWLFVVNGVLKRFDSLDRDIVSRKNTLSQIKSLEQDYASGKGEPSGFEAVFSQRQKDYTPLSFLEQLADESGARYEITYREPRGVSAGEEFLEASVRVELRGVGVEKLMEYIYAVESSEEFLRIKNLNIRLQEGLLNVNFEVSTIVPAF